MQANRYDRAAEAPILNTYVPINFDQLYRIGAAQKQAVDEASKELSGAVQTFAQFQSPSEADTRAYYDATIGKFKDLVEQAATNPDAMKDAAFRQQMQQRINNLDYAQLSNLRQSREGMLARQKANQELMLRGQYNPLWHDVNFGAYDTTKAGVFNDVSPLAYKSEVDIVKPFVDNLKASFLGSKNGFLWKGVTEATTDAQVSQALSSIQNTPEYQKHVDVLVGRGMNRAEATDYVNNRLLQAGREFAYQDAERDPWWMKQRELAAKYPPGGDEASRINNLTTLTYRGANRHLLDIFSSANSEEKDIIMNKGLSALPENRRTQLQEDLNPDRIRNVIARTVQQTAVGTKSVGAGLNKVMKAISFPASSGASDIFTKRGSTQKIKDNIYSRPNSSGLIYRDDLLNSMLGTDAQSLIGKKAQTGPARLVSLTLSEAINKGLFTDLQMEGTQDLVTDGKLVYQQQYAYIPREQVDKYIESTVKGAGYSIVPTQEGTPDKRVLDAYYKTAGINVVRRGFDRVTETERRDDNGEIQSVTASTSKKERDYVAIPVYQAVPNEGEAAITNDALYNKLTNLPGKNIYSQQGLSQQERSY